jgi:hypothetical protein
MMMSRSENLKTKLNSNDYEVIASMLVGTRDNVYRLCERMFNYKFVDDDFDQLEKQHGVKKCEECNTWKDSSEFDKGLNICQEC